MTKRASELMLGMGCAFPLRPLAETASQNSGNSATSWLSERRAKDAKRKNRTENGVKTTLRMA